jgi:diamine N-acetyltransferase
MEITIKPITRDNWQEAIDLKVGESQRGFVASNLYSIAESHFYDDFFPCGIYDDDQMVGFVMYGRDPRKPKRWWIIRLMVDEKYQKRGYGRVAKIQAIDNIKARPDVEEIVTSFVPENQVAANLYVSLGFVDTGEIEEDEPVYRLESGS